MDQFQYVVRCKELETLTTARALKAFCHEVYEDIDKAQIFTVGSSQVASVTKALLLNALLIDKAAHKRLSMKLPTYMLAAVYQIRRQHESI